MFRVWFCDSNISLSNTEFGQRTIFFPFLLLLGQTWRLASGAEFNFKIISPLCVQSIGAQNTNQWMKTIFIVAMWLCFKRGFHPMTIYIEYFLVLFSPCTTHLDLNFSDWIEFINFENWKKKTNEWRSLPVKIYRGISHALAHVRGYIYK